MSKKDRKEQHDEFLILSNYDESILWHETKFSWYWYYYVGWEVWQGIRLMIFRSWNTWTYKFLKIWQHHNMVKFVASMLEIDIGQQPTLLLIL